MPNNFVSLSLFVMFCLPGYLYAQMPPALDFPQGREFDPRYHLDHLKDTGEPPALSAHKTKSLVSEANISENVELVGATGGAVYDVFAAVHEAEGCVAGAVARLPKQN